MLTNQLAGGTLDKCLAYPGPFQTKTKRQYNMVSILNVLSSSGKTTVYDEFGENHDERYLTLINSNGDSDIRYYVSLSGKDAEIEWQEGDRLMVDLGFCAYKSHGQWHMSHNRESIKVVDVDFKIEDSDYYGKER